MLFQDRNLALQVTNLAVTSMLSGLRSLCIQLPGLGGHFRFTEVQCLDMAFLQAYFVQIAWIMRAHLCDASRSWFGMSRGRG